MRAGSPPGTVRSMGGEDPADLPRPRGARPRSEGASERWRAAFVLGVGFSVSIGGPLAGALLAGRGLGPLLEFPPRTETWDQPGFSWAAWLAMAVPLGALTAGFVAGLWRAAAVPAGPPLRRFPAWGWASVAFLAAAWIAAWTRLDWLSAVQQHTFTPLWVGFVLVVNALTYRRSGHCLLTERPGFLAILAVLSAGFWWMFEILNRVAENWHYRGLGSMGDTEYFVLATVPFMTVLPAVASSSELLRTYPRLQSLGFPQVVADGMAIPAALVATGTAGLVLVGLWPEVAFPFVWLGPAMLLLGLDALNADGGFLGGLRTGDWSAALIPGLAALLCGACWEMWNWQSLAGWEYTVPYVDRFDIFAMPVLGYAGYVPFGVTCGIVIHLAAKAAPGRATRDTPA